MKIVIYHRADFDGVFCREIAKRRFGAEAQYIGWDYGDPVPVIPDEVLDLYMLDISIEALMGHPGLTWIDHHKTAIAKYTAEIPGYRIDGVAACRLAWQWFFGDREAKLEDYFERRVNEPLAVQLAGEYDIWDKRDERAELFQHGLRSREIDTLWDPLLTQGDPGNRTVFELLKGGRALQYARQRENESIIKAQGFTVQFEGLTLLACNAARYNSHLFAAGILPQHDGLLGFNYDGKKFRVSLYGVPGKPDVDLSVVAAKFGGGGHKQACGFEAQTLPFLPAPQPAAAA